MPGPVDTPLILDTHSWIWLLEGDERLAGSPFIVEAERASVSGRLYVSAISIAEVALLVSHERLRFSVPLAQWLEDALETPGLQVVEIDAQVASEGAALPGDFRGDAADRLIVASARLLGGRLATADAVLTAYAAQGYVTALSLAE